MVKLHTNLQKQICKEVKAVAKYEHVYQDLRHKILDGYYAPWGSLDNEEVLCKRYEVSRPTLQKAIRQLKQDGFIHSKQGSGIFVNPPEFFKQDNLTTLSERLADKGSLVTSDIVRCERNITCPELAPIFRVGEDETYIHYERLRRVDGKPHAFEETYMPEYLFKNFDESVLHGSMISYIEKDCGYEISHDIKSVSAVIPSQEIAGYLGVDLPCALLQIDHYVYLTRSICVQFTREITLDNDIRIAYIR